MSKAFTMAAALVATLFLSTAMANDWPPLPATGFITGRVATAEEAATGKAFFCAMVNGAPAKSTPIKIKIPQYAYYHQGSTKTQVIIMQAETVQITQGSKTVTMSMVGARGPDGKGIIGLLANFELLGTTPPK